MFAAPPFVVRPEAANRSILVIVTVTAPGYTKQIVVSPKVVITAQ